MAFGITENTTSFFVNNRTVLPRFQRKATWKEDDNFKLCISVFKGYPIGVIIVNEIHGEKYLLDGRQRRTALLAMYKNPVEVYRWAKHFLRLKDNMPDEEVRNVFSDKIGDYLQSEFDKATEGDQIDQNDEFSSDDQDDLESRTFDTSTQSENLNALLDMILMVHGRIKSMNKFEGIFSFKGIIDTDKLEYSKLENGSDIIDPAELKEYLKDRIRRGENTKETFYNKLIKNCGLDTRTQQKLKQYINDQWQYIEKCFSTIQKTEDIIINAQIGLIRLIDASPLDAQNIFSLVNGGGAKLTAEELLSARPYWNVEVKNPTDEVKAESAKLYQFLSIPVPSNVVRWDVCASLLSRIDKSHLIFSDFDLSDNNKEAQTLFTRKLTMGFKLLSAEKVGGISSSSVKELENERRVTIDWDRDVEQFVQGFNVAVSLLYDCQLFKYLMSWKQSVMSLLGNSVSLEFATLIYKKWKELGEPKRTSSASQIREFQKGSVILFDRLVYEYSSRLWTGSGDSHLARDLQDNTRFDPVQKEDWKKVIQAFLEGKNPNIAKGTLYYYYCLKKMSPRMEGGITSYEIDHIYPQARFASTITIPKPLLESIGNKALLPKGENIDKSDHLLNELKNNAWLIGMILDYTGIASDDIEKYSDFSNMEALIAERGQEYYRVFDEERDRLLNSYTM